MVGQLAQSYVREVADANYEVVASAGKLRPDAGRSVVMPHRWTAEGVVVEADFTGAHERIAADALDLRCSMATT